MKADIILLSQIAQKPQKTILGLMSGTSLDGLDLALCKVSGSGLNTSVQLEKFVTHNYSVDFKQEIKSILGKQQVSLEQICLLNAYIGDYHAKIINESLKKWGVKNEDVDLIASHGQTIYHSPKNKHQQDKFGDATLQIGDADRIAFDTKIITVSDFRQKHIAGGGQGAPLAIYGDYFLMSSSSENRVLLNIGGIANFTYIPKTCDTKNIICTDTGPGNTLMDAVIQQYFDNKFYDENASIALQGKVNNALLQSLLDNSFFNQPYPKTTGQEVFNLNLVNDALATSQTTHISIYDIIATLNYFTAITISNAIREAIHDEEFTVYASGGGVNNTLLMQHIQQLLPHNNVLSTDKLGVDANAKEAILFAVLANECICGDDAFYNSSDKTIIPVTMGKISLPH